jgi:hypothetical protein
MMTDIVRPLWDYEVFVSGTFKKNKIDLEEIKGVD